MLYNVTLHLIDVWRASCLQALIYNLNQHQHRLGLPAKNVRMQRDTLLFSEGPDSETAAGNMRFNLLAMLSFAPKRGKCYFFSINQWFSTRSQSDHSKKITVVVFILYFLYIYIYLIFIIPTALWQYRNVGMSACEKLPVKHCSTCFYPQEHTSSKQIWTRLHRVHRNDSDTLTHTTRPTLCLSLKSLLHRKDFPPNQWNMCATFDTSNAWPTHRCHQSKLSHSWGTTLLLETGHKG